MEYLSEAFKELKILDEDVFDLDKEGLEDLRDFQDEDEEEVIDVYDPDAETEEELEDSYVGKVILDCSVCHTDIYKDKEDVIIDEDTQLANIGEECPYCFSIDGFKVIGEVKPFVETELETEDDVDVSVDGEKVEVEEEEESLRKKRIRESISKIHKKALVEKPIYALEPRYDARKSFYGKAHVDTGDNNDKNKLYSYDTLVAEIKDGKPVVYGTYSATTLRHIKDWLKQNGFRADTSKQIVADYGVKDESCTGKECARKPRKPMKESSGEVFHNDNGLDYTVVERSKSGKNALLNRGKQWIIAWNCPQDNNGSWGQGHYFFDESEAREWWNKKYIKESKTPVKISRKSLKEGWDTKAVERFLKGAVKDIMDEKGTCATMKLDNRLAVCVGWSDGYYDDDDSVIHAENDPEWGMNAGIKVWTSDSMRTDFDYINAPYNKDTGDVWDTSVSISPNEDYASLASYFEEEYDKMKEYEIEKDGKIVGKWGEDEDEEEFESLNRKSRKKNIKESVGQDVSEYQKWVDYDMKKYKKISKETMSKIKKAGLSVVKDQYGDYEVIADRKDESLKESQSLKSDKGNRLYVGWTPFNSFDDFKNRWFENDSYDKYVIYKNGDKWVITTKHAYEKSDNPTWYEIDPRLMKDIKKDVELKKLVKESLKESIEDITIDTGDQEISVSARDKEKKSDGEMIAPLSDEMKADIEMNSDSENGEDVDVEMDEFSEEDFDELGESYLKKVYENVNSYKTTSVKEKNNKLYLEGIIKFSSGKEKKTSFVFEAKTIDKNGHAKFLGENLQISRGHKAFKLSGTISNRKFISESLNYNYRAKNGNSSQRVYGTVRANKK